MWDGVGLGEGGWVGGEWAPGVFALFDPGGIGRGRRSRELGMRGGMLGRGGVLDGGRSGVVGRELGGVWIWGGGVYLGGTLPEQDVEGWGKGVLGEGRSGVAGREFGGVGIECGEGWLGGTLPGWGGEGCGEGVLEWSGGGVLFGVGVLGVDVVGGMA